MTKHTLTDGLSAGDFTVTGTAGDVTPPRLADGGLSVSRSTATAGETVRVSARLADDGSGVRRAMAVYENPVTGGMRNVALFDGDGDGVWEGDFAVGPETAPGTWRLVRLHAYDGEDNDLALTDGLSAGDFTVTGTAGDVTPPRLADGGLSVSRSTATAGETVRVSARLADDGSGVRRAMAVYENPVTGGMRNVALFDGDGDGVWEGDFAVGPETAPGTWRLVRLHAYDGEDNDLALCIS